MPEQRMHTKMPMFQEAQRGSIQAKRVGMVSKEYKDEKYLFSCNPHSTCCLAFSRAI